MQGGGGVAGPPPTIYRRTAPVGRDRSPAFVLGLSVVTLGIYYFVWYGKVNAEIGGHDPDIGVNPGLAVLAMFVPFANLISAYATAARIRQMQLDDGASSTISPVVALLLFMFLWVGYPLYIASQVREHWHGHRRAQRAVSAPAPEEVRTGALPWVGTAVGVVLWVLIAVGAVALIGRIPVTATTQPTRSELQAAVLGDSQHRVPQAGVESVVCLMPSSWVPGATFLCYLYRTGRLEVGAVEGTVLPSVGTQWRANLAWTTNGL